MQNLERFVGELGRRIGVWVDGLDRPAEGKPKGIPPPFFSPSVGGIFRRQMGIDELGIMGRSEDLSTDKRADTS